MAEPKVLHARSIKSIHVPGGGKVKRVLSPKTCNSENLFVAIGKVRSGRVLHSWHTHEGTFEERGFKVTYPENYEEAYVIVRGSGVLEWKNGKREKIKKGDVIYFPKGVVEHQVINTGKEHMVIIVLGTPPLIY